MWNLRRPVSNRPVSKTELRTERLEARDVPSAAPVVSNFNAFHDELLPVDLPGTQTESANGLYVLGTASHGSSIELDRLDRSASPAISKVVFSGPATSGIHGETISADGSTVAYIDASQKVFVATFNPVSGKFGAATEVPDPVPTGVPPPIVVHNVTLSQNGIQVAYSVDNAAGDEVSFAEMHIYNRRDGSLRQIPGLNRPVEFLADGQTLLENNPTSRGRFGEYFPSTAGILARDGTAMPLAPGPLSDSRPLPGASNGTIYKSVDTPFVSGNGQVLAYTSTGLEAGFTPFSPTLRIDAFISTGPGQITPITDLNEDLVNPQPGEIPLSKILGISEDGRYTLFITNLQLSSRDTNGNGFDYYVYDRKLGKAIFLGVDAPSIDASGAISRDGTSVIVTTPDNLTGQSSGTAIKTYALGQFANRVVAPAPAGLTLNGSSVSAFAPEGTFVGQLGVSNAGGHHYTYHLTDPAGGRFRLDGDRLIASNEYQLSHSPESVTIRVLAVDELGNRIEQTFAIAITDHLALNQVVQASPTGVTLVFNNAEGARRLLAEGRIRLYALVDGQYQWTTVQATRNGTAILLALPNAGHYRISLDLDGDWNFETNLNLFQ